MASKKAKPRTKKAPAPQPKPPARPRAPKVSDEELAAVTGGKDGKKYN